MIIAKGHVINLAPAGHDWVVAFDLGDETGETVCPVVGWATVARAALNDGSTTTEVEPAFLWGNQVWIETDFREHAPNFSGFEIRAREITRA